MTPKVAAEVARLPDMTVNELVRRYEQVCGEECRSRNKQYLTSSERTSPFAMGGTPWQPQAKELDSKAASTPASNP